MQCDTFPMSRCSIGKFKFHYFSSILLNLIKKSIQLINFCYSEF